MSTFQPARPRQTIRNRRFAVVASQFNGEFVRGLVEHFRRELETIAPNMPLSIHEVPGAFEIPLLVQEVAERGSVDGIAAFGVIIAGETAHAQLIATNVTESLQQCALRYRLPVIHGVLLVENEAQARVRCLEPEGNRGIEAARSLVRMVQTLGDLKVRP